MRIPKKLKLTVRDIEKDLQVLSNRQADFEQPWRSMINFILPARAAFISDAYEKRRTLVSDKIINNAAKESASVLAAALQTGLTPPNSPWLKFQWENPQARDTEFLKRWMQDVQTLTLEHLAESNFYDAAYINYLDLAVINTSAIHSGPGRSTALNFQNYSVGEYLFRMGEMGKPDPFIQVRWVDLQTIKDRYGEDNIPVSFNAENSSHLDTYFALVKAVYPRKYLDGEYVSIHYIRGSSSNKSYDPDWEDHVLKVAKYDNCPNHVARWDIVAHEDYGLGPGFDALPHAKRLQEMERTLMMAFHKTVDPAMNIPAELKGRSNLLPGGKNYVRGDRRITPTSEIRYGLEEAMVAIQRVEDRLQKIFYNDVFLTSMRDPNASPLRTGQVDRMTEEGLMKLGPVVGRIFNQQIKPLVERSVNILAKNGYLPPIPEEYQNLVSAYKIELVSPLAQSMKMLEGRAIQQFMTDVSGLAQLYPEVLDQVDPDKTVGTMADVRGIPLSILRTDEEVQAIRKAREQRQAEQAEQQQALINQQLQDESRKTQSEIAVNMSKASEQMAENTNEIPIQ